MVRWVIRSSTTGSGAPTARRVRWRADGRVEVRFLDGYTDAQLFAPGAEDLLAFEADDRPKSR